MVSRRSFLAGAVCTLAAPLINKGRFRLFAQSESEYSAAAIDLVQDSTVIDMLGLLTLDYKKLAAWQRDPNNFQSSDFERLKASGITIFHPAVGFVDGDVYTASLRDISGWNMFLAAHPDHFLRVDCASDLKRAKDLGKIGIVIGQQNSVHFRALEDVDRFYQLGQRVSQLTYRHNRIGGGSSDARDEGLSEYGESIIERMNQIGMAVDISHCSDRTTLDAIDTSEKPVLITHSNCRALVHNSARCKTDDAIKKMAAKGGVLGVTMVRIFVCAAGPASIENVLDHVDHVARLAGIEHVGIGTDVDLDGRDQALQPKKNDLDGMRYARKIFDLTEGLIRRNYTRAHIEMILGGNFERALTQIWSA